MENYNNITKTDTAIYYSLNGVFHRLDGPAIDYFNGTKFWLQNGEFYRIDGPTIEYADGSIAWYQNDLCHRLDGPAKEWTDGYKEWWFEGEFIECNSQEEFERLIKLKLFW